jgi:hypothetical protein
MRILIFFIFLFILLGLGCRKESLEFTGKTVTIKGDSTVFINPVFTDPNCLPLNPSEFPATGDVQGRIVVNGRVTQLDGARKAGTVLWLFNGLTVVSRLTTDVNGKFKFDVVADTAAAAYYYVVVNPIAVFPPLIPRYNCSTYGNSLQKNKIQTLDISFCEGALVQLKAIKSTDADSVYLSGSVVYGCDQQPSSFGFANQKTDDVVAFFKNYSSGYSYRALRNSTIPLRIERVKNGVKSVETKTIKADSLTKTITLEL